MVRFLLFTLAQTIAALFVPVRPFSRVSSPLYPCKTRPKSLFALNLKLKLKETNLDCTSVDIVHLLVEIRQDLADVKQSRDDGGGRQPGEEGLGEAAHVSWGTRTCFRYVAPSLKLTAVVSVPNSGVL